MKLIGANLLQGFRKRLHDDMGGVRGCTHVTELFGPCRPPRCRRSRPDARGRGEAKPFQLDHCHALATTTDTVRRYYPKWYRARRIARIDAGARVKIHEYQGKEIFRRYRHADAARHSGVQRR